MEVSIKIAGAPEKKQCIFLDTRDTKLVLIRLQFTTDGIDVPENFVFVTSHGNQITRRQEDRLCFDHICDNSTTTPTINIKAGKILRNLNSKSDKIETQEQRTRENLITNGQADSRLKGKIVVKTENGEMVDVEVKPSDKIENLKLKIREVTDTPVHQQELYCNGMPLEDQTDVKALHPEATIILVERITLFIKDLKGKTTTMQNLKSTDRIEKIKKFLFHTEGIPPSEQRLIYERTDTVLDEKRTLLDYNLKHESVIHLVLRLLGS